MTKPSLKEFDITATQYAKYQDYKSRIDDREIGREKFGHRFYEAIISIVAVIVPLLTLAIARAVLYNTISGMLSVGKYVAVFFLIAALLFLFALLFFVIKLAIRKTLISKIHHLKIHRPFKRLYIKLQPQIAQESYYNNAKKYELQNEAYYNYIGNLQQRFPDIIEHDYNLQNYLKKIIDKVISYQHTVVNNSIINHQLEKRRAIWLKMDGITFEREVANIYKAHQYEAKTTKAIGEGGVDIRLWKDDEYSIVQCKNVSRQIDEPIIRQLLEIMQQEDASKAILICSGGFTPKARNFAKNKPLELLDLNQFLKLVNEIYPQEYQLVDVISEKSVSKSNTTYKFKSIGKTDVLYSSHTEYQETNYCLFETPEDAKKIIRRLQRIEEMPLASAASYDVEEWWIESSPSDYYRKAFYYIKVSEKELKTTTNKRNHTKYVQKELWDTQENPQRNVWDAE